MTRARGLQALLASGLFASVVAETFPVGAMPQIRDGLHISSAEAGLLMTVFACVAAIATIPFTYLTRGWSTRRTVTVAFAFLGVSQIGFALAPTTSVALWARAAAAIVHGAIWAQVPVLAANAAPAGQRVKATARVFLGSSTALVAGVPLATLSSQHLGWRPSALIPGAWSLVVAFILITMHVPDTQQAPGAGPSASSRKASVRWRAVVTVCGVTILLVMGHFTVYTYIAEISADRGVTGEASRV